MTSTPITTQSVRLTQGVHLTIEEQPELAPFVYKSLSRHLSGDWGDVDEDDQRVNDHAAQERSRIVSVYALGETRTAHTLYGSSNVDRIWIITDPGWATTTILWPAEY